MITIFISIFHLLLFKWWKNDDKICGMRPSSGVFKTVLVLNTPDDGCLRPKHVEWLCRDKTCTVLHQVGVSFDLYYDARKHKIKICFCIFLAFLTKKKNSQYFPVKHSANSHCIGSTQLSLWGTKMSYTAYKLVLALEGLNCDNIIWKRVRLSHILHGNVKIAGPRGRAV